MRPAGPDGLHDRLFGREANGEVWSGPARPMALLDLPTREDAALEAIAAPAEDRLDASDLDHIHSAADDHCCPQGWNRGY